MTEILTHRGLDPDKPGFFSESSFEAFQDHLSRGFGLEFDVNFTKENSIIIFHDSGLERISQGKDKRLFRDLNNGEIRKIVLGKGERICFLNEFLEIISKKPVLNALHLKGKFQEKKYLDILLTELDKFPEYLDKILIFDVKPETAKYLKEKNSSLILAPSVAQEYDIERYNSSVAGTLISINDAIKNKDLFNWIWLDEWDLSAKNSGTKKFYTSENFEKLRKAGFKIALVTPELHGTSPGLLGGEAHQDAANQEKLFARIKEILELQADLVCTDYPDKVASIK